MKKFKNNTRGQFVIVSALLIAVLTLSLAFSINQLNLHRQQLEYKPVDELVLGITSDLERALTYALSNATKVYNATRNTETAIKNGTAFISEWIFSVHAAYSNLGLKLNVTNILFDFTWSEVGFSHVDAYFNLDVDAYGFKGWVGNAAKHVVLKIFQESINATQPGITTFTFQIEQSARSADDGVPIPNLTPEDLAIWTYRNGTQDPMVAGNVTALEYLGGGNYTVTFSPRVEADPFEMKLTVTTPEDKIFVSAYRYGGSSEPPPLGEDWSAFYVDKYYTIVPVFMWSGKSGHVSSWASGGRDKQVVVLESPATPTLYPARYANITVYVDVNPPSRAKDLTLELGFNYDSEYYRLGNGTFSINDEGVYSLTIDTFNGEFPTGHFGVIPEGSVIILTGTVTFTRPPWGSFFLYYGPDKPSQIELF